MEKKTRKPCYCKDDRAMLPYMSAFHACHRVGLESSSTGSSF